MRNIQYLVVHCTATAQTATIAAIQKHWHEEMKWKNPGYHHIVCPDGKVVQMLDHELVANGVAGHNANSIHVSYIGGIDGNGRPADNRTPQQKASLVAILKSLKQFYPKAKILGHRDFSPDKNGNGKVDSWERIKECPCFDAILEYQTIK